MSWIEKLDHYGANFLIDELVWHLKEGRVPASVSMESSPVRTGVVFHFVDGGTAFLTVPERALDDHWREAQDISSKFNELRGLRFEAS